MAGAGSNRLTLVSAMSANFAARRLQCEIFVRSEIVVTVRYMKKKKKKKKKFI